VRFSLDANLLVYLIDRDAGERHRCAVAILERAGVSDCILTLQVLGEFFHVVTRKGKLSAERAQGFLADWRAVFPIHAATSGGLDDALDAVRAHHLGFWDAMLWATVQQAGCQLLLSEDFQDGRKLGRVTFVNPFEPANQALLDRALPPPTG
jgi:predicted nucleic acid-binding protein